jgi:hypothetical protein
MASFTPQYAFDSLMGPTTGLDMRMTGNDFSLPGIKLSTPTTNHTTTITTANTITTYGHWQEGEGRHPPLDSWEK